MPCKLMLLNLQDGDNPTRWVSFAGRFAVKWPFDDADPIHLLLMREIREIITRVAPALEVTGLAPPPLSEFSEHDWHQWKLAEDVLGGAIVEAPGIPVRLCGNDLGPTFIDGLSKIVVPHWLSVPTSDGVVRLAKAVLEIPIAKVALVDHGDHSDTVFEPTMHSVHVIRLALDSDVELWEAVMPS